MRLDGKVALISGDVLDDEGHHVGAEMNEPGGECLFVRLDVASEPNRQRADMVDARRPGPSGLS